MPRGGFERAGGSGGLAGYAILFGRSPSYRERTLAIEMTTSASAWPRVTHALLMTNEFVIID